MSYPIQSLAVIAPIIFIVFIIAMPVIGVFAGWKRAAYWGGGSFFFFLVGVIIWKAAGVSIAGKFTSLISGMMPSGTTITPQLVQSVVAPVFFMIIMAVAELILLINYYAWFKRVSGIKRDIRTKKYAKAVAKKDAAKMAKYKEYAKPKQGWTQMQMTSKGRIINMACGGAGLGLLMAPSTVTFTQGIYYLTTDAATRANNSFAGGLYNLLQNTESAFSWMSYYNGTAGTDCDSLMSTLHMLTTKVTSYTIIKEDGTLEEVTGGTAKTGVDIMVDNIKNGFTAVMKKASDTTTSGETKIDSITETVENFAEAWNTLQDSAGTSMNAIFQSENVAKTIESIIKTQVKDPQTLDDDAIKAAFDSEEYKKVKKMYEDGDIENLQPIHVSKSVFDTLVTTVTNFIKPAEDASQTYKDMFYNNIDTIVKMMFQY